MQLFFFVCFPNDGSSDSADVDADNWPKPVICSSADKSRTHDSGFSLSSVSYVSKSTVHENNDLANLPLQHAYDPYILVITSVGKKEGLGGSLWWVSVGLVAALARTIAGRRYPPRGARLDRLAGILRGGSLTRPRTLGGCIFRPADADRFLVHREFSAICLPGPVGTGTGRPVSWDGRFRISPAATVAAHSRLGALGQFVESPREADLPESWRDSLPRAIWRTIPALENCGEVRVFAIAGLPETGVFAGTARFAPVLPVSGARFATPG